MDVTFEPGWEDEILRQPGVRALRGQTADDYARLAAVLGPHGSEHYARSVHARQDGEQTRVVTDDIAGHLIEWGSVNNPAYAPLRRAADALGLGVVEDPKP
jgi:hypothetical protein